MSRSAVLLALFLAPTARSAAAGTSSAAMTAGVIVVRSCSVTTTEASDSATIVCAGGAARHASVHLFDIAGDSRRLLDERAPTVISLGHPQVDTSGGMIVPVSVRQPAVGAEGAKVLAVLF